VQQGKETTVCGKWALQGWPGTIGIGARGRVDRLEGCSRGGAEDVGRGLVGLFELTSVISNYLEVAKIKYEVKRCSFLTY